MAVAKAGTAYVDIHADFSPIERELVQKMPALSKMAQVHFDTNAKQASRDIDTVSKSSKDADRSMFSLGRSVGQTNQQFTFFRNTAQLIKWPAPVSYTHLTLPTNSRV